MVHYFQVVTCLPLRADGFPHDSFSQLETIIIASVDDSPALSGGTLFSPGSFHTSLHAAEFTSVQDRSAERGPSNLGDPHF